MPPLVPFLAALLFTLSATLGVFAGGLWAAFGIGGAVLLYGAVTWQDKTLPRLPVTLLSFLGVCIAVLAVLNLFSAYPGESWRMLAQFVGIVLPLALLSSPALHRHAAHRVVLPACAWAVAVGAAAVGVELFLGGPLLTWVNQWHIQSIHPQLTQYNRGVSYLVFLVMPVLAWLWLRRQRGAALLLAVLMLFAVSLVEARAAKLAFLLALAVTGLARVWPKLTRILLITVLFATLAMPFAATFIFTHHPAWLAQLPDSWHHRAEIWDYMGHRIFERPLLGWGLGSSHLLDWQQPNGAAYRLVTHAASHTHNFTLQLWVELGVPGLVLGFAFALAALEKARKLPPTLLPFAYGAWMAAVALCSFAYSVWDDSQFAALALTAFAFALVVQQLAGGVSPGLPHKA